MRIGIRLALTLCALGIAASPVSAAANKPAGKAAAAKKARAAQMRERGLAAVAAGHEDEALTAMRDTMSRLKLTVNEHKTHVCRAPEEYFDFLGYTFGRCYSRQTGRAFIGTRPSTKSVSRLLAKIHEQTARNRTWLTAEDVVLSLNRTLVGWAGYFQLGPVTQAYQLIDRYTTTRLRRWLRMKHPGAKRWTNPSLERELGLVRLPAVRRNFLWA